MNIKYFKFLSLTFLFFGIVFLLNSKMNTTGAVIGIPNISITFNSIFGIVLLIISAISFISGKSLEEKLGIHDFKKDKDYQKLIRDLESRGVRLIKKETVGRINFYTYKNILERSLYNNFPTKIINVYRSDREEYFEIKKESNINANKYLNERLNEINRDPVIVSELTAINHNKGKVYNEAGIKSKRDYLLEKYNRKDIDETEFAKELNNVGEFTGGEYNPGNKHLSVKVIGHSINISGQGNNPDLARAIHRKILENSPSYKPDCEFHYSKRESTKHHSKDL